MSDKNGGFLDSLLKGIEMQSAIEASRDANGRPDPYKAAGIAAGRGLSSFDDMTRLGAMLGSQGAFDDKD